MQLTKEAILARTASTESGCWEWQGARDREGYGTTWVGSKPNRKMRFAHRLAYQVFVGPIPDGLQIDHLCRNRRCCNPGHLDVVTTQENTRRRDVAHEVDRVCRNGHVRTTENTYLPPGGGRSCLTCRDARLAKQRARAAGG